MLEDNLAKGVFKAIGVSNFVTADLQDLATTASVMPAVNQVEYNVFWHNEETAAFCKEHNITLQAYAPFADEYNFFDGLLLADSGDANNGGGDEAVALTGSGNYSIEIDLGTYPISNLGGYEYLMLGFAADVSQQGNTSTINNLLLEAIPEPSSLVLLGAGAAMLLAVRRRAMRA